MCYALNSLKITQHCPNEKQPFKKIMLYRNTVNRIISCFLNWMIRNPKKKNLCFNDHYDNLTLNSGNWLLTLLKETAEFDFNLYKERLHNLNEENTILIFEQFINVLPIIYKKNGHLHPQIKIVRKHKLTIDKYINIDKKKHVKYFEYLINQKIPVSNNSNNKDKQELLLFLNSNPNYKQKIFNIYKADDILNANI